MMKQLTAISAMALLLAAAPAYAQDPAPQEPSAQDQQAPGMDQQAPSAADQQTGQDENAAEEKLAGLEVWSSDGQQLGEVTKVNRAADGNVQSIYADVGAFLGIGGKTVEITSDQFQQKDGRIELSMTAEAAKNLPEAAGEETEHEETEQK